MEAKIRIYHFLIFIIIIGCKHNKNNNLIDEISLKEWRTSLISTISNDCTVNYHRFTDTLNYPPYIRNNKRIRNFEELIDLSISKRKGFLKKLKRHQEVLDIKNNQLNILEIYTPVSSRYIVHSNTNIILDFTEKNGKYEVKLLRDDEKIDFYFGKGFVDVCTNHSPFLTLNLFEIYSKITVKLDSMDYDIRNVVLSD
jgi:hypothetical protein